MATSSSDLKNDIEQIKTPTTIIDEGGCGGEDDRVNKVPGQRSKGRVKSFKRTSNDVITRLAKAAKEAAAAKKEKTTKTVADEDEKARIYVRSRHNGHTSNDSFFDDGVQMFEDLNTNQENLASITKLNNVIDEELLQPSNGYKLSRETDSIRVLLEHNNNQIKDNGRPTSNKYTTSSLSMQSSSSKLQKTVKSNDNNLAQNDIAIVFARPPSKDQLTIEYAVRLGSLVKAMKFEGYKPNLICFCDNPSSTTIDPSAANHRSVTSIGVKFFKHLCSVNGISLEEIDLCRIANSSSTTTTRTDLKQYGKDSLGGKYHDTFLNQHASSWSPSSLNPVVKKLLDEKYLEKWLEQSEAYESDMDEYGMTRQEPRKKIHIHCKLFSTEYHLCNLNNIHMRSPRQSPLARLMHDLEHATGSEHYRRGIIQTTWSFHYSIYPYAVSSNEGKVKEAFLGKCYLMAQSLVPLLVNLKGVVENSEFFQRDNYRSLVATRRSLATLLEQLNEAYRHNRERQMDTIVIPPTFKAQLKLQTSGSSPVLHSIEINLECALLSLGRCCDLVRPAGTFSEQPVTRQEWKDALVHLQEFMSRIECYCDPDRPLPLAKWGKELTENQPIMDFLS